MREKLILSARLVLGLVLGYNISARAESHRIFDRPTHGHARPPLWIKTDAAISGGAPYSPAQIKNAYGFGQLTATGAGQTIAIVDAYDDSRSIQTDLNTFCAQFGLPATTVDVIYARGSQPATNAGWQQEESLDVEWAHAIAPGAKILLVEAASSSVSDLLQAVQVAVNNGATVVSMSWGGGETANETSSDSAFTAPGVTFVASAGDSGAGVEWPAASPNVLSVGGTTLLLDGNGNWSSETAWADGGGGISVYETAQPSWQNGWLQTGWTPFNRAVPDVALVANPEYGVSVVYQGAWYQFGGTSVGAPQWSALIALANQTRGAAFSGANEVIYSLANAGSKTTYGGNAVNSTYFHDVTSGDDGSAPDDYAFAGYDLVTGVGSPVANALLGGLAGATSAPAPSFALTLAANSQTVTNGANAAYVVTLTPSNNYTGTVNLSVTGLPTGATATFSPSSVSKSGSAILTVATGATTPAGTYTLTITGADSAGLATKTLTATLVVKSAATTFSVSGVSYTVSGARYATLNVTFTVVNTANSPVANAVVSVTLYFNGVAYVAGAAQTAANGQVTFSLANARPGNYSTIVTAASAAGLTWNGKYPVQTVYDPY